MAEGSQPTRPVLPNEMERSLSIREFEQRVDTLKSWISSEFMHVKEVAQISGEALEKALELQAIEIARRLDELNHAHKLAMENWARSLPREIFDSVMSDWDKWRRTVDAYMQTGQQNRADVSRLLTTVDSLEKAKDRVDGAFRFLLFLILPGVIALIISILRMAGLVK